jgi:hypothetical protein
MALVLGFAAHDASALGVGRVANNTTLGQPLDFSAILRLEPGESVSPDCVEAEVVVGERLLPRQAVRVTLSGEDGAAERRVRVSTIPIVDEPVVSVTLKVGCPPVLSRNFVAFVDPPALNLAQTAPATAGATSGAPAAPALPATGATAAAPSGPAAGEGPRAADVAAPTAAAVPPARRVDRNVQRPPVAPEGRAPRPTRVTSSRPAPTGPRLRLDPAVPSVVAPTPQAAAPAAPPTDQAADAAAADVSARREAEEAALRALEQSLTALRNEALSTQRSVAILQARLAAAEAQRYQNWLVYSLAAAVVLLALALLLVAMRLRQARRERGWWSASSQQAAPAPEPSDRPAARPSELAAPGALTASPMSTQPAAATAIGGSGTASMPYLRPSSESVRANAPAPLPEPRREVSVEELIDLEQQAEFFIVLGQDDAAIDVLMGHLRSTGGTSPLPYLKLLEIYRRRDDREAYERIRDRFNRRFSAYAPEWGNDLQQGRSLEDYPERLQALQDQWQRPADAMETLEASLLRQEQGGETFDLPAYREVLFLYAVARDLAEHDIPDTVDLLLPIGDDGASNTRSGSPGSRPSARSPAGGDRPVLDSERSERYDVDFQFGTGSEFTGSSTTSRGGGTRKK